MGDSVKLGSSFSAPIAPSGSLNSNSATKYHGLIQQNYFKTFRRELLQLFDYIYSSSPPFTPVHNFMTYLRIIQFLFPCLCPGFFNFWRRGSLEQVTVNVISFIFYLVPPTEVDDGARIILYLYLVIQGLKYILFFGAMIYFKKYAKLPNIVPMIITFYSATLGFYFHPIVIYLSFSEICASILGEYPHSAVELYVLSIIAFLFMAFHIYIIMISAQSLAFRPCSLISALSGPQNIIICSTIFINLFLGVATRFQKYVQVGLLGASLITYLVSISSIFISGGFVFETHQNLVLSSSITGACFSALVIICLILDQPGELMFIFIFIGFFLLIFLISHFVIKRISRKRLILLDLIYEDPVNFDLIKKPNHFLNILMCAVKNSHPIVLNLKLFQLAFDKWQNDQKIWYSFAKFIAMYPEETQTLSWIFHNVKSLKISGAYGRCIKEQTSGIISQREPNLSAELKTKLNTISKELHTTKHKLRNVWDVVIQGNIGEVEISSKRALYAMKETDADFKHLLRQYPNNRFVTRAYSRFLLEIMADHAESLKMIENTHNLQRGITVNKDQTHELGLTVFKNLPEKLKNQTDSAHTYVVSEATPSLIPENDNADDEIDVDFEQILTLRKRIEDVPIPGILFTKIIRILFILIFYFIPCIFALAYFQTVISTLVSPLQYISELSQLHSFAYQLMAFSIRFIGENASIFETEIADIYKAQKEPMNFGETWNTREQLTYLSAAAAAAIQNYGTFRSYDQENENIKQAQNLIFNNTVSYKYYYGPYDYSESLLSLQSIVFDFLIQQNLITTYLTNNNEGSEGSYSNQFAEITPDIMNTSTVLNLVNNAFNVSSQFNTAYLHMSTYLQEKFDLVGNISFILMITISIIEILVFIISLVVELKWIKTNKQETYQCLLALPKNTVSALSESLRLLKKEKQENSSTAANPEMNKQEENILKIFFSGGGGDTLLSDVWFFIVGSIINCIFIFGSFLWYLLLINQECSVIQDASPHLVYVSESYTMMLGAINYLNLALFSFTDYKLYSLNVSELINLIITCTDLSREYFHLATYGGASVDEKPFSRFTESVTYAETSLNCTLENRLPENIKHVFECFPVDMKFILYEPLISNIIYPFYYGYTDYLDPKDPTISGLWHEMIYPLYDLFFSNVQNEIIPTIESTLRTEQNKAISGISILLVVIFIIESIIFSQLLLIESHIRKVLKLLLHCPIDIVLSTPKIMKILSGNFSAQKSDAMNRDSEFFDSVFVSLPDAIMYANSEMIIQAANLSCQRIFGDVELVGKPIKEFFSSSKFSGKTDILFSSANTNPVEHLIYRKDEETELHLEASSMYASGNLVLSCRDVTQSYKYTSSIKEQRAKCDQFLATILPTPIVKRIQDGEKNISFSVQSASILFADVIDFASRCESQPAANILSILNIIFKRFDAILSIKPTMTKIKSIGDCYIAAGGIFAEINQPTEHAKEAVTFGIEIIQAINDINKEKNENLSIRVGVNTGGPIIAGVIGTDKPSFEVLGLALSLAQEMETSGVPMAVNITRTVYELIYGDTFTVRERGMIDLKGGSVQAYLVTQK